MAFDKEKINRANRRNANSKREALILLISIILAVITSGFMEIYRLSLGGLIFVGILFFLLYLLQQTAYYAFIDHHPGDYLQLFIARLSYLFFLNVYIIFNFTRSAEGMSVDGELIPGRMVRYGGEEVVCMTLFTSIYLIVIFLGLWVFSAFKKNMYE